jgi:hypothetical protein
MLLVVVSELAALAPSALSRAFLAEVFRVVRVHLLGLLVHLMNLVKGKGGGLLVGEGVGLAVFGIISLEVVKVVVLLLELRFELLNLLGGGLLDFFVFMLIQNN